jgi:hypothetical protein
MTPVKKRMKSVLLSEESPVSKLPAANRRARSAPTWWYWMASATPP